MVITAASAEALFQETASVLAASINEVVAAKGQCVLGIVGGRSMPGLFKELRKQDVQGPIHIFWLDERVGKQKNYKPVRRHLWLLRMKTEVHWYPIKGTTKITALQQAQACCEQLASLRSEPAFDIVLVSAGEDGHIASLFPGHAAVTARNLGYEYLDDAPKPPPERVTVSPPLLLTADEGYLFFTGTKHAAYDLFLSGATHEECPAKLLEKLPKLTVCTALSENT